VPHIYAETLADANFGLGYCQAEDNLSEILRYYVLARAEGGKAFGREAIGNDYQLRMLKVPQINQRLYEGMELEARQIVVAFAEGIDRYLADHPGEKPQWYESHLVVGDRWLYGSTFFGGPPAGIGFTQDVAWGATNNGADTADVYREKLNPDNSDQYFYDGQWHDITTETIELDVRGPDGKIVKTRRTVRRTHHGPIVQEDRRRSLAYAARLAGLETVNLAATCAYYFQARRIADLEKLYDTGHLYKWHRIACDRHGDIGYWFMAATHRRSDQFNWKAPVDGTTKETEWGPRMSWCEMPHTINPPSGLLVNCNNNPYTVTPECPINPEEFPRHLTSRGTTLSPSSRAHRAIELLTAKEKIDFADMERVATDIQALTADVYLQAVLDAYDRAGDEIPDPDGRVKRAVDTLKSWDGLATVDNKALPILAALVEIAGKANDLGRPGRAKPRQVLNALSRALDRLEKRWGSTEVAWGCMHVIRRGDIELPIGGAGNASAADPFTTLLMAGAKRVTDGKYVTGSGTSWIQLVKYHRGAVEAKTILPYGNSNRPDSPHYADQMPLFARGQLKNALITRQEI
jgi:acyl-homoserine-lactone acylase